MQSSKNVDLTIIEIENTNAAKNDSRRFPCRDPNCSGSVVRTEKARFCCDKCGWVQRQI